MDYLGSRTTAEGNVVHSFVNYGDKVAPASAQGVVGEDYIRDIMTQARANSNANMAWSANQAAHQMNFQRQMQQDAMAFNAAEAAKNREWQAYMSNSAFQRQVADLKAAGLNPVLAAGGGNGAPVTSGATAAGVQGASGASGQIDSSSNGAIVSLLGSWISSLTALENQRVSAQSNEAVADKYNAMAKWEALLTDDRERWKTELTLSVDQLIESMRIEGTLEAEKIRAEASKVAAGISAGAIVGSARVQAAMSERLEGMKEAHAEYMAQKYPQTEYGAYSAIFNGLKDLLPDWFDDGRNGSRGGSRSAVRSGNQR